MTRKITYFATTVPYLEDSAWRELESIGFPVTDDQKQQVIAALNHYLTGSTIFQKAPTEKEIKKRLEMIEKFSRELAKLAGDSTEEGQAALSLCFPFHRSDPSILAHLLYELAGNSKAASEDLQDGQGGNPGNPHLKQLIRKLYAMFLDNGGTGVGATWNYDDDTCSGDFSFMVKKVFKLANIPYKSEASLYLSIRRAVKNPSRKSHT